MDLAALRRLASEGLAAFPPSDLDRLADWCWDYGEATGDARYTSLWRLIDAVYRRFEDAGAVNSEVVSRIDGLLTTGLADVLDASEASEGSSLARLLREEVFRAVD